MNSINLIRFRYFCFIVLRGHIESKSISNKFDWFISNKMYQSSSEKFPVNKKNEDGDGDMSSKVIIKPDLKTAKRLSDELERSINMKQYSRSTSKSSTCSKGKGHTFKSMD